VYPQPKMALYKDSKNKYVARLNFWVFLKKFCKYSGRLAHEMKVTVRVTKRFS
jgi:hypothetical protein